MEKINKVFSDIYRQNSWGDPESVSGPGSSLEATRQLAEQLKIVFQELGIRSIVDAPCGDFNWMKNLVLRFEKYIGIDIVSELIENLRRQYDEPNINFQVGNIVTDILPAADVLFCRDCLVHLPVIEIQAAMKKWKRAGFTYLMSTTFPLISENTDIEAGGWRPINLEISPFNLGTPMRLIAELPDAVGQYADKSIGVWRL